jgi:hypothetical protein
MKRYLFVIFVFGIALTQVQGSAIAQATQNTEAALQAARFRAGEAYRQLQQAQYEAKLAEQDYLNAQEAHRVAQNSEASKSAVESTRRALDVEQAKVAAARKAYEKEVNTVDRLHHQPTATKSK